MTDTTRQELANEATAAKNNAFTIVSGFPVGAAVLTESGKIYRGCNVESIISGMGTCAERNAIDNAIAYGDRKITTIYITSDFETPITPCGMCRQYISDFAKVTGQDITIIMQGKNGQIIESSIHQLLPSAFGPDNIDGFSPDS